MNRPTQTVLEGGSRRPPKALPGTSRIERSARLPVRLAGIENEPPLEAHQGADQLGEVTDPDLTSAAEIDGIGTFVPFASSKDALSGVLDVKELARRRPVTPERYLLLTGFHRLVDLADDRWNDVRGLQVEIVAGPIQIHWKHYDGIEPILLAVRGRLYEQHLLRQSVRRVRLFGIPVPEVLFAKRHRREFRVRADRTGSDHFSDSCLPSLVDDLHAHHEIVVEELAGVFL